MSLTASDLDTFFTLPDIDFEETPEDLIDPTGLKKVRRKKIARTLKNYWDGASLSDCPIIYSQDRGVVAADASEAQTAQVLESLEQVRTRVHQWLEKQGAVVLRVKQTATALKSTNRHYGEFRGAGWGALADNPSFAAKIGTINEPIYERREAIIHPHLVAERLFVTQQWNEHREYVVIAPNLCERKTLQELNGKLPPAKKRDVLAGAFTGVDFLHDHDLVHCDVKPSNIFVERQKGAVSGQLFDLDGVLPSGVQHPPIFITRCYSEDYYYQIDQDIRDRQLRGYHPIDSKRDIFSAGHTVLDTLAEVAQVNDLNTNRRGQIRTQSDLFQMVDVLLPNRQYASVGILIKSMVQQKRSERPSMKAVIEQLRALPL